MPAPFHRRPLSLLAAALLAGTALATLAPASPRETLVGSPCEGCEAAFDGRPREVPTHLVLHSDEADAVPLHIEGQVRDADGRPRSGVLIYLHQTNAAGRYPPAAEAGDLGRAARNHGRLRGWVRSDPDGHYRISTVRPGSYPGTGNPQHVHMQVIEPGCVTYLIDDLMFRDDPRLTPELERRLALGAGGGGVVQPRRTTDGWVARRDIVLGQQVPGYRTCQQPQ
jgi:protocatechuate 3,4-dioxygenase beta subunit